MLYEKPSIFINSYRISKRMQNMGLSFLSGIGPLLKRYRDFIIGMNPYRSSFNSLKPLPIYCNPEIIVRKDVAQIRKSIAYGKGADNLEKSAQITVHIWKRVVNFPNREGLIFNGREVKKKIRIPRVMITSRLMTITVSQLGKMFKIAKAINEEAERSLSAAGSR